MRVRVILLLLLGALAVAATACGGAEEVSPLPETVEGTTPADTGETETETETEETETEETETEGEETETEETETEGEETETAGGGGGGGKGDPAAGKSLFAANGCGSCHVLKDANAAGTVGPNLDDAKPSFDEAAKQIANGGGGMPPYKGQLSQAEIDNLAAYVVQATGG